MDYVHIIHNGKLKWGKENECELFNLDHLIMCVYIYIYNVLAIMSLPAGPQNGSLHEQQGELSINCAHQTITTIQKEILYPAILLYYC